MGASDFRVAIFSRTWVRSPRRILRAELFA